MRPGFLSIATAVFTLFSCTPRAPGKPDSSGRIVSLIPAATEVVFALGRGERLVGVTRYCTWPPQTAQIPKVGGYIDANMEQIISLEPDLVLIQAEHRRHQGHITEAGIPVMVLDVNSFSGICSTVTQLGRRLDVPGRADSLVTILNAAFTPPPTEGRPPRILLCIGRDTPGGGTIAGVFAAGPSTVFGEVIAAAGGENALDDSLVQYPQLSRESIMMIAPDIIIELLPTAAQQDCRNNRADWYPLSGVPAVTQRRLYCITGSYATIPGPRITLLIDDIRACITDSTAGNREIPTQPAS